MIENNQNAADAADEVTGTMPQESGSDTTSSSEGDKAAKATTLEEALAKLNALEAEKAENAELLKKLRKFEKENKQKAEAEMKAKGEYQKLYEEQTAKLEAMEAKARDRAVNAALELALKGAVKDEAYATAMKLADKSQIALVDDQVDAKSIAKMMKDLRAEHSFLFKEAEEKPATPSVKRSSEGAPVGGFDAELAAAKTMAEYTAVLRKHGK